MLQTRNRMPERGGVLICVIASVHPDAKHPSVFQRSCSFGYGLGGEPSRPRALIAKDAERLRKGDKVDLEKMRAFETNSARRRLCRLGEFGIPKMISRSSGRLSDKYAGIFQTGMTIKAKGALFVRFKSQSCKW
jgi:hypothetical protein